MSQQSTEMPPGWHLDKRVPIALILALVIQGAGLIMWGVRIDSRVSQLEQTAAARTPIVDRFLKVEADQSSLRNEVTNRLDRIENKVDRLLQDGR